jgi:hypothetical protein
VARFIDLSEDPPEITDAKIVHMLVEDFEPGVTFAYPVETRHFNIYFSASAVRVTYTGKQSHRILDVLKDVPQDDAICPQTDFWTEIFSDDVRA